jgi:pimeloyl-ACP methyl ester carboxylesterase
MSMVPGGDPATGPLRGASPTESVELVLGSARLAGDLAVPPGPRGLIVFAHGSGSSRHSPRNRFVAGVLNRAGFATVLFDLLSVTEERNPGLVFDVELLAHRLDQVTRELHSDPELSRLPVGFLGASTGAAATLRAAASADSAVEAIVSRGGRPDLASGHLGRVRAPTLLVVGGRDLVVLELNRRAQAELRCQNQLQVVPGATHVFEEPGALQTVAEAARRWFAEHLRRPT